MSEPSVLTNKIRSYLQALSPRAVESLVHNLEKARASGSKDPHVDLILEASLDLLRKEEPHPDDLPRGVIRRNNIQRLFFSPLDTFLINENLPNKQEGRIYRPYLGKVWRWLERDILPAEVRAAVTYSHTKDADPDKTLQMATTLRVRATRALADKLQKIEVSEKERRRLGMEIGGERGISDLKDIHKIFTAEKWLVPFLHRMPDAISERRLKQDEDVLRMVETCADKHPGHIPVVAAAIMERASVPSSLCAFAGRLASTDDARNIGNSAFAPFVDMVMSEAERLNVLAQDHRNHNPDPVAFSQALLDYHKLVRGVELDLDLSNTREWQNRLADTKRDISSIVSSELEGAHGAVRRALQVPRVDANGYFEQDTHAIDDAVRALRVVVMVKNASETFAVNDIGNRTRQTVEQTLEIVTRSLLNELRTATGKQKDARLAAVETAIMLSEIYYGAEYAAQLRRSRQNMLGQDTTDAASA